MTSYYAIERSPDFLAHYGIKGMRWGVRKAIERNNKNALSRNYQRAAKKLAKLSLRANQQFMQQRYKNTKARMFRGALGSAVGSAGLSAALNYGKVGVGGLLRNAGQSALLGGVAGGLLNSRGISSRLYTSDKGHARAVKKRDEWRKEMESAFKGTEYGGKKQRAFHKELTRLSNVDNPRAYVNAKRASAERENDRQAKGSFNRLPQSKQRQAIQGLSNLANKFEGHYQKALSRGMSHVQAEAYANRRLNAPSNSKREAVNELRGVHKNNLQSGNTAVTIGTKNHAIAVSKRPMSKADLNELRRKRPRR